MNAANFSKPNMRPQILEVLKHQSPLHSAIIKERVEAMLGHQMRPSTMTVALSKMVTDGYIRRIVSGIYGRINPSTETE